MFKFIDIHLEGPICRCPERDLDWFITTNAKGQHGIGVRCRTCKTELLVSPDMFKAGFALDRPYPGKPVAVEPPPPPKPKVEETGPGRVIDLLPFIKRNRSEEEKPS